MKTKTIGILAALALLLAGASLWHSLRSESSSAPDRAGQLLFPALRLEQIAAVEMTGGKEPLRLVRRDSGWQVESRFGYPAEFAHIARLLESLRDMRIGRQFDATAEVRQRLGLQAPGNGTDADQAVRIRLTDAQGAVLAELLAGKNRGGDAAAATGAGQYVMVGEQPLVTLVDRELEPLSQTTGANWIDPVVIQLDAAEIAQLTCRRLRDNALLYVLTRAQQGQRPQLDGKPPADGKLLDFRIDQLLEAVAPLKSADVLDPAQAGSVGEAGHRFEYRLFDGRVLTIRLGGTLASNTERHWLRVDLGGAPPEVQQRLAAWTYLIPTWQAELFLTDRNRFYESRQPAAVPAQSKGLRVPQSGSPMK